MTKLLRLCVCAAFIVASVYGQSIQSLKIVPERTYLLTLEGDELKLDCIVQFSGKPNVVATFSKDGMMLPVGNDKGYEVLVTEKPINSSMDIVRSTTTLKKNVTDGNDKGVYKCDAERGTDTKTTSITVYTFTASGIDAELPIITEGKETPKIDLECNVDVKAQKDLVDYAVTWERDGAKVENGDKYNMENNTLQILKPTRADMGEYQCVVTFFPTSSVEKHTVRPKPSYLKAGPAIDSHDNNKNLVQGDNLELKCKVSGFPKPTVSWFKDGSEINTTTRIHTLEYEGAMGKLMIYSLEDEDEGYYKCFAENDVEPLNATAEMRVRVKDKYAALWPFLGIVVEVVVLCVIILVYEKRRSKKLEEEDAVDSNQDNPVDHKDVRHRRT
ncbi:neuroplastin-like isoform X2 [Mercenaria mercenaria]|uniref:neuroplastin-like isoform X2 n=1 Tax=Mercenaria mercenaria TaxID=6596 RepID=UPI001E1DB493|nr:neuroplastin-like isoform X2 [Mercenaria mercenaria]